MAPNLRAAVRWLTRGALAVLAIALLGWGPAFAWMAPVRIDRTPDGTAADGGEAGRRDDHRFVLLVSVDGLAPRVLAEACTPHLDRLAHEGAVASEARTVVPSITMTAHTSMLSGLAPQDHGVRFNRYEPWRRIEVATVFSVCERERLRCGLLAGKRKFAHFAEFEAGVQRYAYGANSNAVLRLALDYVREASPDFVFIHLAEVDLVGHDDGWGSAEQRAAVEEIDALLGAFLTELPEQTPRPVTLIVTADHGGSGTTHGSSSAADVALPGLAWGDGVTAGASLGPVSITDTAPTVLTLLGVVPPKGWAGRALL